MQVPIKWLTSDTTTCLAYILYSFMYIYIYVWWHENVCYNLSVVQNSFWAPKNRWASLQCGVRMRVLYDRKEIAYLVEFYLRVRTSRAKTLPRSSHIDRYEWHHMNCIMCALINYSFHNILQRQLCEHKEISALQYYTPPNKNYDEFNTYFCYSFSKGVNILWYT